MRKIILFVFTAIVIGACTSIDCPVQNSVYTVYGLLKANGTTDTLTVDSLSVTTLRANQTVDTLLDRITGKSTFDIPISYTQPEDTLFFTLLDTLGNSYRDTVYLKKDNYPHFESVDCQASYFHRLTDVRSTHHIIDSIVINNPTVNYEATSEHFYLYLKARY
jgi:hypothetical protein